MTTEKQILANRQNAQSSTGPCTIEGKAIVSKNAIKYGLFTKEIAIDKEETEIFAEFFKALFEYFSPETPLESVLVEKIIANTWRLRRLIGIESFFFNKESMKSIFNHSLMVQQQSNQNMITLSRYEQSLERSLFRNLQALKELKEGMD